MKNPKPTKRTRQVLCVSSSTNPNPNPNSISNVPDFNQNHVDSIISSFLSLPDLPSSSSFPSIGCSFDQAFEKFIEASGDDNDFVVQDCLTNRSLQLASLLHDSAKRCYRKGATLRNSSSWCLPHELTFKVFSMVDTKSLMQAMACCTMFNKCAMDPLCYSHIDLTTAFKHVGDRDLRTMIHRAGKELRSLKLGSISSSDESWLTKSCLAPLSSNHGFAGGHMRSLHLYNLRCIDSESLYEVLSNCSNLTDLKILGFDLSGQLYPLEQLGSLTRNCRLIKHLFLEHYSAGGPITDSTLLVEFVDNCPNVTSLTLLRFGVNDAIARTINTGFRQLKYLNLSGTTGISGCFLRDLGLSCIDGPLETLILRNCYNLKEREVLLFLNSLRAGDFKSMRYIDVSSVYGLVPHRGNRTFEPKFPTEELKKRRSSITFLAIFDKQSSSSSSSSSSGSSSSSEEDEEEEFYDSGISS